MMNSFRPDGFNIELTTSCPLRCPQCYCSLEGGKNIPLARANQIIEQAAILGVTHLELSGGETLCYPHLYEIISEARKHGIAPSISTSGWNFDEQTLADLLNAGIENIFISLNAPTEEENAKTRDGFQLSIHALEILKKSSFRNYFINWVMHRESVKFLKDMILLAEDYNVPAILIIEPKPNSVGELNTYPTYQQLMDVASMVKKQAGNVELIVQHCFSPLLALVSDNKLWGNRNTGIYQGCTAGLASFCVNVDGFLSPCRHLDYFEEWKTVEDYWNKSSVLKKIRSLGENKQEPCLSCRYCRFCRHCLAANSKLKNELYIGYDLCPLKNHNLVDSK